MKNIAVLSGDKRQIYANSYLNNNGFCSYIKNNFDFNEDAYILCGTPFSKDSLYLNCDLYSSFPISTFIALLKPGQTVFAGNISSDVTTSLKKKNINMIALRQQLLPAGEREQNIPCDLKDPTWFDKIDASGGAVFFASGVFYYFLTQQVRELVQGMADAFPGGVLVFDAANRTAVKMIAKTWLKTAKIKDVGAYFAISDAAKEIGTWDSRLQVSSRGYMLGYSDLKDPSVGGFFRFLAKVGDNGMKMQIAKIRFGGNQ